MRYAEPTFRVLVAGVLINLGAAGAGAEVRRGGQVDLQDRVFFDRFADRQEVAAEVDALLVSIAAEMAIVALPEGPLGAIRGPMPAMGARSARTVVAALAPSKGGLHNDASPVLPWASGPAVPKPLSGPPPAIDAVDKKPGVPDAPVPRLDVYAPQMRWQGHAPTSKFTVTSRRACAFCVGPKTMSGESDRPLMSRLPDRKQISTHAGDPLGALQFDDENSATAKAPAREFIMPFASGRVTSLFNQGRRHPAIDLAGALGSPVFATTSTQTVVFAARRGGYGNAVITRDQFGRTHLYGHLKSITSRIGQVLSQGDKLGHLGSTGHSTGPHVHYEVRNSKGQHINPVTLLFPGRGVGMGYAWLDVQQDQRPAKVVARVDVRQDQRAAKVVARVATAGRNALAGRRSAFRRADRAAMEDDE